MYMKGFLYLIFVFTLSLSMLSWFSGGSPGGKTGSPGDGANCTQCHAGSPNQATGWITSTIPSSGYVSGETYTVTATGTHSGVVKFGFEVTAEDDGNAKKGTFMITDAVQTKLTNGNQAVTHTASGNTPSGDSKSWSFDWTAPAEGTGDITFYGAFNAANGNGTNSGDVIYLSSLSVTEDAGPQTGLTISLAGMTPHVGQMLEARLINKYDLMEVERETIASIPGAEFDIFFENIVDGESYRVDFYADHNGNGVYDAPPTDHAWRLNADNVVQGTVVNFTHNTFFTDIDWRYMLSMDFGGMTPHIGQLFEIRLIDITMTYEEAGRYRLEAIPSSSFTVDMPGLMLGHSYNVEFYADHNGNGLFDPVPDDHAWRLKIEDAAGDESLDFTHNLDFTDIGWQYALHLELNGMNPHVGQSVSFRLVNSASGQEVSRMHRRLDLASIMVQLPGLETSESYELDFYADHNGNGMYDAPPDDHAWRLETGGISGNTDLEFTHNTDFTDIDWKYMVTLHAEGMTPHLGQLFELRVYDENTFVEIGNVSVEELEVTEFYVNVPGSTYGEDYNIDFYADHNGNGGYDPPPTDHAWRINVAPAEGDTVVPFTHNTNFTDIMWPVSVDERDERVDGVQMYPNPFGSYLNILPLTEDARVKEVRMYSLAGALIEVAPGTQGTGPLRMNTEKLQPGMYYLKIIFDDNQSISRAVIRR